MKACERCGKGSIMAGTRKLLRGHYNPTNWSRKYPNLQKATLPSGERGFVCTKCLKSMAKHRPGARSH
jgi:ribosomal protein S27AE